MAQNAHAYLQVVLYTLIVRDHPTMQGVKEVVLALIERQTVL